MPKTHAKIATGKAENKFGIPISRAREVYARAAKLPGLQVTGVDMHIGSQITELQPFDDAFALLSDFVRELARRRPRHLACRSRRRPRHSLSRRQRSAAAIPTAYAAMVKRATRDLGCTLIFEPGRLIVGNAGILVTRVLYLKRGEAKTFVIVDAGMNDLIRPTLYEAHHDIRPVRRAGAGRLAAWSPTWSGRSANRAISWRSTASCRSRKPGDLLAVMTAGAYGAVQAGTYNTRAAGAGSACAGRRMGAGAAAPRGRGIDRAGSAAALAVS